MREPRIMATDGKRIEVGYLRSLPNKLTRFDNLDKVSYKISQGSIISEEQLQGLFDKFNVPCVILTGNIGL